MKLRLQLFFDNLRYSYVTVPMSLALGGLLLAILTLKLDTSASFGEDVKSSGVISIITGLVYSGGVDGARALLSSIAGSIISVAALASSIAITALALASGQFGSRLLRNFMDDRGFQTTLGIFNGTFLFCLVVLRSTRDSNEGGGGVPQISVTVALILAVACVFLLIYFLHHMARAIQAPYVIADAAHDLNQEIERLYGKGVKQATAADEERSEKILKEEMPDWDLGFSVQSDHSGYVNAVNYDRLLELARREESVFRLAFRAGDWIGIGDTLITVWPPRSVLLYEDKVRACFISSRDRSAVQDPEYGVNQLVEVASRALSPGINDPFTAITCLDYLGDALNHVLRCDIPSPYLLDEEGTFRIMVNNVTFPGLCDAAFNMIRQYGADSPAVMIRILEVLARVGAKCRTDVQSQAIAKHARLTRNEALKQISVQSDVADIEERHSIVLRAVATHKEQMG